jgi:outer membrane murein-binding lipoprotein Lpp
VFEFRFSSFLKALLLFACIIGGCDYLSKLDKLKADLAELKSQADTARETADLRRQEWTEIKTAKDKLDQLEARMTEVIRQRDLLDTKERKLTGEIKYMADSMAAAVEKIRSAAIGTEISELRLAERPALLNAKILKITDDAISFLHEDGVASLHVKTNDLPMEFVQKYDLGTKSIHRSLQRLKDELSPPASSKSGTSGRTNGL